MMNLTKLKKLSSETGFKERVEGLGFFQGPDAFWFYRNRGGFTDVIVFWIKSSKKWVEVPLVCVSDEIVSHCDMSEFPKGFTKGIPIYTGAFISKNGVEIGGGPWKIADEDTASESLNKLAMVIESDVDPWFKSIDSNQKLFQSFSDRFKETEEGMRLKKVLDAD